MGVIPLAESVWKQGESDSFAQHSFALETAFRTFHFYTITRDDMLQWKSAIELCSSGDFTPASLSLRESSVLAARAEEEEKNTEPQTPSNHHHHHEQTFDEEEKVDELPTLKNVAELRVETDEDETKVDSVHTSFQDYRHEQFGQLQRLGSKEMSNSESRYFKKFGLKPPEQVNKRSSVLLTQPAVHAALNIQEQPTPPQTRANNTSASKLQPTNITPKGDLNEKVPLLAETRTPNQPIPNNNNGKNQPPQNRTNQPPSQNKNQPPPNRTNRPQQTRRPPPDDECSCVLL